MASMGINIPMEAIYVSGTLQSADDAAHRLTLNLPRSKTDSGTATFLCRFIELWCSQQCTNRWRIEHHERDLIVVFQSDRDCVLFSLTDEYEYMSGHLRKDSAFTQSVFR